MAHTALEQGQYAIEMPDRAAKPFVYANHAMVDVSPYEAVISFGLMDAAVVLQTPPDSGAVVEVQTVARIAVPHKLLVALTEVLRQLIEDKPGIRGGTGQSEV
ncbi:MAG: hypothetical protein FJX75_12055 [Armatimonadetes bacterium]|nr:hypothetical protein [Armatimonadota bacterium]